MHKSNTNQTHLICFTETFTPFASLAFSQLTSIFCVYPFPVREQMQIGMSVRVMNMQVRAKKARKNLLSVLSRPRASVANVAMAPDQTGDVTV